MDGLGAWEIKLDRPPLICSATIITQLKLPSGLENRAFDYLSKPFKVDEMLDIVKRAIESSRMPAAVADPNAHFALPI